LRREEREVATPHWRGGSVESYKLGKGLSPAWETERYVPQVGAIREKGPSTSCLEAAARKKKGARAWDWRGQTVFTSGGKKKGGNWLVKKEGASGKKGKSAKKKIQCLVGKGEKNAYLNH